MFITEFMFEHFDHKHCILPCSLIFLIVAVFLGRFARSLSNIFRDASSWNLHNSVKQYAQYNLPPITITSHLSWAHILQSSCATSTWSQEPTTRLVRSGTQGLGYFREATKNSSFKINIYKRSNHAHFKVMGKIFSSFTGFLFRPSIWFNSFCSAPPPYSAPAQAIISYLLMLHGTARRTWCVKCQTRESLQS